MIASLSKSREQQASCRRRDRLLVLNPLAELTPSVLMLRVLAWTAQTLPHRGT
jgi:hypothetical protein